MKKTLLLLTICLALLSLCACAKDDAVVGIIGGADGPTSIFIADSPDELTPVTLVLDWTPNINHAGAYAAQQLGYFAAQGLDVTIVEPGDNLALQLVSAGQADFGFSYQEEVTYARMSGVPAVSLAAVIQHNTSCFAAPKENGITSVRDFAGKTYGGWSGQIEPALFDFLLQKEGLSDPVTIIDLGSTDFFSATAGDIDFSWIFYGVTGVEAELRGVELDTIYLKDIDPIFDYYTPVVVTDETTLAERPELVSSFMTALAQGYQYADAEPKATAELMLQATDGLDGELTQAGLEWMAGQYQDDAPYWGYQDEAVWSNFAGWLEENNLLEPGFMAEDAFTNDYLPQNK